MITVKKMYGKQTLEIKDIQALNRALTTPDFKMHFTRFENPNLPRKAK